MGDISIQKRRSGTMSGAEKITGVKNAQAEMLLNRRINQYQLKHRKNNLNIALEEYRLENEARLLSLDSKTHDLEYKRRLYPNSDLSHEEMSVQNLQKYLGRNTTAQCYLDKRLGYEVRNRSAPDYIPAVVAEARRVLRRKELLKELEDARRGMYSFMRSSSQRSVRGMADGDPAFMTEMADDSDEEDQLDLAVKNNQVMFPDIPEVPGIRPNTIHQPQKSIREKLQANPVVREALENHRLQKQALEETRREWSPTLIISRMQRRKPLTKTDMLEEVAQVNESVEEFNKRIDDIVWTNKQEEFEQGLKFIKDKDTEWNKEKKTKRWRVSTAAELYRSPDGSATPLQRRPVTSYVPRQPYTEKQKKQILMEKLLHDIELKPQNNDILPKRRGIPYHTNERMNRYSASAKLERMKNGSETGEKSGNATDTTEQDTNNKAVTEPPATEAA